MSSYVWSNFDLNASLGGVLVGIQNEEDNTDITMTGLLEPNSFDQYYPYRVTLGGALCYVSNTGLTLCPTDNELNNQQLENVKVVLDQTVDNKLTRSSGGTTVYKTISTSNPRDQFAMEILNAIIQKQNNPEGFDDGTMMRTAQIAYRWANAMMEAAADNRYADGEASNNGASTGDVAAAVSGDLKIKNAQTTGLTPATIPLVVNGGSTYSPDSDPTHDISDVLKVNVVAGGGGGGGGTVDGTISIGNAGLGSDALHPLYISGFGKDEAATVNSNNTNYLQYIAAFCYDAYGHSLFKVGLKDVGIPVLAEITNGVFPLSPDKGYYYKFKTTNPTSVAISLPAVSTPANGVVNIIMFNFELTNSGSFSVTAPSGTDVYYRGSNPGATLAAGKYEIDCLDNGSYWIVGVTAIVS